MKLPKLNEISIKRAINDVFRGYNHNLRINDNEFYDMENLTSDFYPVLSPRGKRGMLHCNYRYNTTIESYGIESVTFDLNEYLNNGKPIGTYEFYYVVPVGENTQGKWKLGNKVVHLQDYSLSYSGTPDNNDKIILNVELKSNANFSGLLAKDSLCYVEDSTLYINGYPINNFVLSNSPNMFPKRLVSMGAYIIVMPDKKWLNTANTQEYGNIENKRTNRVDASTLNNVKISLCKIDGAAYSSEEIPAQSTPPTNPSGEFVDKAYWIDTSGDVDILKQYSATSAMWVTIATTYLKIESNGIGIGFNQYDGVTISGLKGQTENEELDAIDGNFTLWSVSDNSIVIVGMLSSSVTITNEIIIERKMPALDFIIESENRLWGCKYGIVSNGEVVNEIYACKLGDFKNWNCFMGLSTDSYVASCGTDGQFTGAFTYLGHPLFFKEGYIHKVYGNYPSNYQIQSTACRGVEKGSSLSLAMVNETLFYKGKNGICAYDGSLPQEISYVLGDVNYSNAVGCSHRNKYYISMQDDEGNYSLFVYDVAKKLWHREDNTRVQEFCSCRNELYYIDIKNEYRTIKSMFGSGLKDIGKVKWMAETGAITSNGSSNSDQNPDKKYISKLTVRMSLDRESMASFFIQYDSMGEWEHIGTYYAATNLQSYLLPVLPKRCDHFKLRIEGQGDAKLYSITKSIEQGSDA